MSGHVLIVEDEAEIALGISHHLEKEGFTTDVVGTGKAALESLEKSQKPSAILLDLMLPDMSGNEVCRQVRATEAVASVPIIMVTARSDEIDKVVGFELGADDYVTKPFSLRELGLRVHAVIRRANPNPPVVLEELAAGDIRVCQESHQVWVQDEEVTLTYLEFRLLATLMERRGRVQTRSTLLSDVWDLPEGLTTRTVDTHIKRLREKLGPAEDHIETIRGVGYRFKVW